MVTDCWVGEGSCDGTVSKDRGACWVGATVNNDDPPPPC